MQNQKAMQKLRTHSGNSNTAEVPLFDRQSTPVGRDSRLLMLHRKCPNPLMCVGSANNNMHPFIPTSVPFASCSPFLCQPLPGKPRLRPVASLQEAAAEIRVVGNAVRDSCPDGDLPLPSCLSAKQKQMRRKVYNVHSADSRSQGKQTGSEGNLEGKRQAADIYIPTSSSSIRAKPPSESRQLTDQVGHGTEAVRQNAYYIDVVLQEGRLKMEHVENPRPLPPRHCDDDDDNDADGNSDAFIRSLDRHLHQQRPDSVSKRRCVTDLDLRSSRHFVSNQPPNVNYSNSLYASPPPVGCSRRVFSGDSEQTFYRVSPQPRQNPNDVGRSSRTACVEKNVLQRHSAGQRVLSSADKLRRRHATLKKAVSDIGRQILRDEGHSSRPVLGKNRQALPVDSSEYTESCSIRDKFVFFTLLLAV